MLFLFFQTPQTRTAQPQQQPQTTTQQQTAAPQTPAPQAPPQNVPGGRGGRGGAPEPAISGDIDETPAVTHHSVHVGGKTLNYTATAAQMPIKNAAGDTEAH